MRETRGENGKGTQDALSRATFKSFPHPPVLKGH